MYLQRQNNNSRVMNPFCLHATLVMLMLLAWVGTSKPEHELEVARESRVVILDVSNFTEFMQRHAFVVVEFYAPWCGHCKNLAPAYEKAATELQHHDPPIILAKVDANEEFNKGLATKYEVKGFPTMKIIKNQGQQVADYKGPREAGGMVTYLLKMAGPPSILLSSMEQAAVFLKEHKLAVVGVFGSLKSEECTNFLTVADKLRSEYAFTHTLDPSYLPEEIGGPIAAPAVRIYKPFDEDSNDATNFSVEGLIAFLEEKSLPIVTELTNDPENGPFVVKFFNSDSTKVFLVLSAKDEEADALRIEFAHLAKSNQQRGLRFLIADSSESETAANLMQYFGVKAEGLPVIIAQDQNDQKFAAHRVQPAQLAPWLIDFKEGKLELYLKSERIPESNDEPVKVVVAKSFNEMVLESGKNGYNSVPAAHKVSTHYLIMHGKHRPGMGREAAVLLNFYAPWCGHCKKLAPTLNEVAATFDTDPDVIVAKLDATANDFSREMFDVKGFPTLYMRTANGLSIAYDGDRSKDDLIEFVNKHRNIEKRTFTSMKKDEL